MNRIKPTLPLKTVIPLLLAWLTLSILGLHFHELGLEEGQQYLFARDSQSIADLYHNMRYEGHPRLWCILLYFIIHFITANIAAIQTLHLLITTTTVFLLLRYAPIDTIIKAGLVFGYYLLFEYNLQSRSYALGILLLFTTCLLLADAENNLPLIGVLLLLLCNTDIFYAFAATGIFLYLLMAYGPQRERTSGPSNPTTTPRKRPTGPFILLTLLFLAGLAAAFIQAQIPRQDYIVQSRLGAGLSSQTLSPVWLTLSGGWLPIPNTRDHFWNTFLVNSNRIGTLLRILLSLFFLLLPAALLKSRPRALVFYYSSLLLLLALLVATGFSAARYFGMVVIYLIAAWWLAANESTADWVPPAIPKMIIGGLVGVQSLVGLFAWQQDLTRPFSQANNAVAWLKHRGLDSQPVVVNGYIAGPALSVYLGKKLWYLNTGNQGSFCLWRRPYFPIPPKSITEEITTSPFLPRMDSFLLLSSKAVEPADMAGFRILSLQSFRDGILPMEDCYIYQAKRTANEPTANQRPPDQQTTNQQTAIQRTPNH